MRITNEQLEFYVSLVNSQMNLYRIGVYRRNNAYALDLYDNNCNMLKNIRCGLTKFEIYEILVCINEVLNYAKKNN